MDRATARYRCFAPCPRGLEGALAAELAGIGASSVAEVAGGAAFEADRTLCYRANLHSRIASRILAGAGAGSYRTDRDLYALARDVAWERWFDVDSTIRVDVTAVRSPLKSLDFATLRVKDAICDRFRERTGRRPNVDTADPDVRIWAHLSAGEATLYLDTSGQPLFKRGWRRDTGEAPLRENLAAGLLAIAGWRPGVPLLDPMCGSGTIPIEAARIALGIAPGATRHFGFEKLVGHDPDLWRELKRKALGAGARPAVPIHGRDRDRAPVEIARRNADAAGVADAIEWTQADVREGVPPESAGVVVSNPPYGVRLAGEHALESFYRQLGSALKQKYPGWSVWLLSADLGLPGKLGLRESRRAPLYNGAIACRLFEFRMIAGRLPAQDR